MSLLGKSAAAFRGLLAFGLCWVASIPAVSRAGEHLPPLGHNLFTTTYLIEGGSWIGGNYYLGHGFGDSVMVATSPWIWANYNMSNLELKTGFPVSGGGDRVSFEAVGFKTLSKEWAHFRQESTFLRATYSHPFTSSYVVHFGAGHQYFWDDTAPYSLRPRPWNNDHYALSLGALQELRFGTDSGMFFETGILGLNYKLPFLHFGVSYHKSFLWGFVQVGLSASIRRTVQPPPIPVEEVAWEQWQRTYIGDPNSDFYVHEADSSGEVPLSWRRWFVHPEIQVEFPL